MKECPGHFGKASLLHIIVTIIAKKQKQMSSMVQTCNPITLGSQSKRMSIQDLSVLQIELKPSIVKLLQQRKMTKELGMGTVVEL